MGHAARAARRAGMGCRRGMKCGGMGDVRGDASPYALRSKGVVEGPLAQRGRGPSQTVEGGEEEGCCDDVSVGSCMGEEKMTYDVHATTHMAQPVFEPECSASTSAPMSSSAPGSVSAAAGNASSGVASVNERKSRVNVKVSMGARVCGGCDVR
jgi:hypothetical protein